MIVKRIEEMAKINLYEYIIYENNKRIALNKIESLKKSMDKFIKEKNIFSSEISKKPMKIKAGIISDSKKLYAYSFIKCETEIDSESLIDNEELEPIKKEKFENFEGVSISKEDFLVIDIKNSRIFLSKIFEKSSLALKMIKSFDPINLNEIQIKNIISPEFINNLKECKSIKIKAIMSDAFEFDEDLKDTKKSINKISSNFEGNISEIKINSPQKIVMVKKFLKNNNDLNVVCVALVSDEDYEYTFNTENSSLSLMVDVTKTKDTQIKLQEIVTFLENKQ